MAKKKIKNQPKSSLGEKMGPKSRNFHARKYSRSNTFETSKIKKKPPGKNNRRKNFCQNRKTRKKTERNASSPHHDCGRGSPPPYGNQMPHHKRHTHGSVSNSVKMRPFSGPVAGGGKYLQKLQSVFKNVSSFLSKKKQCNNSGKLKT